MVKKSNVEPTTADPSAAQTGVRGEAQSVPKRPAHAEIAQCAYFLWVAKGRPSDQDAAIWLEAEASLCGKVEALAPEAPRAT